MAYQYTWWEMYPTNDIQVVGEDMIPLGKVKDFSPYIAKIKASGAKPE